MTASRKFCLCPALRNFAETLPRFNGKPISHEAHKRIFSDRDPLFYWRYA